MTNIIRPEITTNFTVLPNQILGFGRHIEGLKPRDSAVLNYLLSKPSNWKVIAKDIATAVNISINTVYAALATLRKLGIVNYTRDKFGYCRWVVTLSETLYKPITTPHTKKPREENNDVLVITNKAIITNKTTTNNKVVEATTTITAPPITDYINEVPIGNEIAPFNLITEPVIVEKTPVEPVITFNLPHELTEIEKLTAIKSLKKANLDIATYSVVLLALKTALTNGVVHSPLAYLHGLLNKAKDGSLDTRKFTENKTTLSRSNLIKTVLDKYGDKILLDLVTNGAIQVEGLGLVQYSEVKELGLVSSKWIKKYNDIQLEKITKLSATIPTTTSFKPLIMPKPLSGAEFEAVRLAKVEAAMAIMKK